MDEFVLKYVRPMDTRTYIDYILEYTTMREHYWIHRWLKAEMTLAESRRDHLLTLKVAITCIKASDHMRAYIGIPASDDREGFDVEMASDAVTAEIEKAETTVREWHEPDIWQLVGYEPPIADA